MNRVGEGSWTLRVPDRWTAKEDEVCITLSSENGFGALQLSGARNLKGSTTDQDLRDFAHKHLEAGARTKDVHCGDFSGFYLHYSQGDMYQRQWWMRCADTIVLATYTCELLYKGKEDAVVDAILNTLRKR